MFRTILLIVSPVVFGSFAYSNTSSQVIPNATESAFEKFEIERSSSDSKGVTYEIYGSVTYSNECMAKDFKFKRLTVANGSHFYEVFGSDKDSKICSKIYMPVTFRYLIDKRSIEEESRIPEIYVNDIKVN